MDKLEFNFSMPVAVKCGVGSAKEITPMIKGENVLIISDPFLYQNGVAKEIGESLKGKAVSYYHDIQPNPTTFSVDECAVVARDNKVTTIIGIGGGSAMDVSKVVSCLTTNEGSIYDYYAGGTKSLATRQTKLILIPTTAGTGSEVTNVGVYTDPKSSRKVPFVNDEFWADIALIDPELTYTVPKKVTAATGLDAFTHAIEAYWNKNSQPICDYIALGAMDKVLKNIETAYNQPDNTKARGEMIIASLMAGIAFSQTRTTGIHALSFPFTTDYHLSHGEACAITLPAFIRVSKEQAEAKMTQLAEFLGFRSIAEFADSIEALMERMSAPTRLSAIGVEKNDIETIAEIGLSAGIIQLTPATMNKETVVKLLNSIY